MECLQLKRHIKNKSKLRRFLLKIIQIRMVLKVRKQLLQIVIELTIYGLASSGSCAVAVLRTPSRLFIANLGDCRAVASVNSMSKMLTRDHKATDPQEKVLWPQYNMLDTVSYVKFLVRQEWLKQEDLYDRIG